ncbi:hypothetical protein TRFO_32187 [Tritrichomonas foetus]|uniref:Uncharacterized protein n=1 Tax=Tritrichomonas foetus TaxID=1144522 RepID=A0A1J4JQE2_9EUKA|nr:hypothetical protein TRFO_32187 [Tritrichomonas foetus]|eukprot:OHT00970.1 hypothetical protein TRFO_32187 [Tritrichomonas foetus]
MNRHFPHYLTIISEKRLNFCMKKIVYLTKYDMKNSLLIWFLFQKMTDNADSGHYHRSPAKKSKMFQPDPPIERQVQQIEQYFQDLIKCINDEIQTTRDYSYDADNSPRKSLKNRKKSSNSATIDAINYNLKEDIHKLFCDAWRFLRQGQKFDIGDQVQDMKSLFIQEFNDIKIYMQNLRNEQLNLLRDTVEIKGMKLKDSIIFNISNLMNDLIESLYADLLEIWLKSLDYNDHEFASSIFSSLLDNLADFSIGLNNFHFDIIRNVESLSRPIHETVIFMDTPDYIEATTQQLKDQKLCEFFEDYLNDTLVEFQEAANISHSMNQKITEFYNQMFEK